MKLLFLGSPGIAVPFLEACAAEHEVAAVVTQPDKPAGRGMALTPPPVKEAAQRLGLRVLQPERPSEIAVELKALGADMAVVVAYGRILKPEVLSSTRHGFMNVHFSLLPRHRGAAPIQWALMRGDARTGVTLFWLDAGMDTGPVQRAAPYDVRPEDDALTLAEALTRLGVGELRAALSDVAAGRLVREPQRGEASLAPKVGPGEARLSLSMPAAEAHGRVRGLRAGPKAFLPLLVSGKAARLTLLRTRLEEGEPAPCAEPGAIARLDGKGGVLVQFSVGRLWLLDVQPEGKKQLRAADFLNGLRLGPGGRLQEHA